jgi:hypothetical protein
MDEKDLKHYALIALIAVIVVYAYHAGWLNMFVPGRKRVANGTPYGDEFAPGTGPAAGSRLPTA